MIDSRLCQRFGWTQEVLDAQDADWVQEEIEIMNMEAVVQAQKLKEAARAR